MSAPGNTASTPNWETLTLELRCPRCGYNLRGLPQPRCPECGLEFEWTQVLAATARPQVTPFEHQWRRRPLRSFVATLGWTLVPWRLWPTVQRSPGPRVKPLVGLIPLLLLTYILSDLLQENAWQLLYGHIYHYAAQFDFLGSYRIGGVFCALLLAFVLALFASAWLVCRMGARHKITARELLRIVVLAWVALVTVRGGVEFLQTLVGIPLYWLRPRPFPHWFFDLPEAIALPYFLLVFCTGLTCTLRTRYGWLIGILALLLAVGLISVFLLVISLQYDTTENIWRRTAVENWPRTSNVVWHVVRPILLGR